MDELKGIMVPILGENVVEGQYERSVKGAIVDASIKIDDNKVDLAEGQYGQSIQDTAESRTEASVCTVEDMDASYGAMLESISVSALLRGASNGLGLDDSSDVGSLDKQEVSVDLRDGDLASADLQPGHLVINKRDRRMMMNGHESDHVQTTCRLRADHAGDRAPMSGSMVNHGWREGSQESCHPPRTSRSGLFNGSGKFYGSDVKPGLQPGYCCHTFLDEFTSMV